jgi:hypothetical protein
MLMKHSGGLNIFSSASLKLVALPAITVSSLFITLWSHLLVSLSSPPPHFLGRVGFARFPVVLPVRVEDSCQFVVEWW